MKDDLCWDLIEEEHAHDVTMNDLYWELLEEQHAHDVIMLASRNETDDKTGSENEKKKED